MSPLFSIVVPIYNIDNYLEQCILSIIDQTFTNFEAILVDDGSQDRCPQICDEYAMRDSRIKVVHKKSGGLVSARQAGVVKATGEYIACIDGDDWICKDYLAKFSEVISQYNPDVCCCGSIWKYQDKETRRPPKMNFGYYDRKRIENEIFPNLIERSDGGYFSPSLWAKVLRREIYMPQQLAVNISITIGEDGACIKPCIYHSQSMYVMEDCLYYYRQNPTSMTKKKKAFCWIGPRIIGQHFEERIDMNTFDFQEQVYRNVVHNLFNVAISQFNRNESYKIISKDIKTHISSDYYQKAINMCVFKKWSNKLANIILKYKLIFLMNFICKIKVFVRFMYL